MLKTKNEAVENLEKLRLENDKLQKTLTKCAFNCGEYKGKYEALEKHYSNGFNNGK